MFKSLIKVKMRRKDRHSKKLYHFLYRFIKQPLSQRRCIQLNLTHIQRNQPEVLNYV